MKELQMPRLIADLNQVLQENTSTVQDAIDILNLLLAVTAGIIAGIILTFIWTVILRTIGARHEVLRIVLLKTRVSVYVMMAIFGGGVGYYYALDKIDDHTKPVWASPVSHGLLIAIIIAATVVCLQLVGSSEDIAKHYSKDSAGERAQRVATQAQILRRIGQAVVIVCGVVGVILTFPQAWVITGSVLASAGVISIVAGMAAQSSLSNMFAGLQIAISDSLRVGDIVVVNNNGVSAQATIEEITLTYVVVRIWDDRRIIIPSTQFTQNSFENWTRRAATLLGTVEIEVDWSASVQAFRNQVDKLLNSTDLWDGRSVNVQVINVIQNRMVVRVAVSARNAGDLWDLRCYLREHLIEWLRTEAPYAIPRTSVVINQNQSLENIEEKTVEVEKEITKDQKFLVETGEKQRRKNRKSEDKESGVERTPIKARRKIKQAIDQKMQALEKTVVMSAEQISDQLMTVGQIAQLRKNLDDNTDKTQDEESQNHDLSMERLYSGSPENEERAKIFEGPGQDVIEEREKTAQMQAVKDEEDESSDSAEISADSNEESGEHTVEEKTETKADN